MPAGSVWEVYIPQDQAYGEREQGDIKPFSALIFKIELVEATLRDNEEDNIIGTRPRGECFFFTR